MDASSAAATVTCATALAALADRVERVFGKNVAAGQTRWAGWWAALVADGRKSVRASEADIRFRFDQVARAAGGRGEERSGRMVLSGRRRCEWSHDHSCRPCCGRASQAEHFSKWGLCKLRPSGAPPPVRPAVAWFAEGTGAIGVVRSTPQETWAAPVVCGGD